MTDPVALATVEQQTPKPKKKKPFITSHHIRQAAPLVSVGLTLLGRVKKVRPYARVLQELTSLSAAGLPDDQQELLARLKTLRTQIVEAETNKERRKTQDLRTQMDVVVDMLLEKAGV